MVEYARVLLGNPATRAGLAITLVLSVFLTIPIARRLGWSTFGTGLSFVGLGGAISVTFVNRLGSKDLVWDPDAVTDCLNWTSPNWLAPESLLNLVLLAPLGLGLYLASRDGVLSVVAVVATAIGIETLQAVLGLGECQPSDGIRNVLGGLAGVALGWLIIRSLGENAPSWLCPIRRARVKQ